MEHTTAITTKASCRTIGNCHVKNSYIFRYGEPWQLPASVGRCGVALKLRARIFAPTFDKTLFFSWLAKMTVENLCKTAQIFQSDASDCPAKMAAYDNFQVNCHKKRAIFAETPPLHFGVKEVF